MIISSYHRDYLWSQATQRGLGAAMLKYGYLENIHQSNTLASQDVVESARAVIRKEWMDTKRRYSSLEIAQVTTRIMQVVETFQPDLVLLGDDNAAHYIGSLLLDTATPVVFWGINGLPLKYGLVDSLDRPGHNVTGVWQSGYLRESLDLLHHLAPEAKTFAVLACDSVTARAKVKQLQALARKGKLPLELVDVVVTNSWPTFQQRTLALARQVDAFFVLNHDTLKDADGQHVEMLTVGRWYLEHIRKPETSHEGQFVEEGMLCTANDSGYNQGYTAFEMAVEILDRGAQPSQMPPRTPPRGPLMVNRERAKMLGIDLETKMDHIEEVVDAALALRHRVHADKH
ncbi:MAG: hypothetical protein OEU26_12025 [Candidatus Tectomicrobia bacterium]|nr:hypothetical protein [Candidatus Tectomicrobia bacterium]